MWLWVHPAPAGRSKVLYGFVGLRFVRFQDQTKLIGWCKNCLCGPQSCRNARLFSGQHRPNQPASWLCNAPAMCASAQHAVEGLGGDRAVHQRLQHSTPGNAVWEGRTLHARMPCTAVRASDAFDDWGVVDGNRRCTSCSSDFYRCKHVQQLQRLAEETSAAGVGARATAPITQTELLKQLKPYLNEAGEVPISSISQLQLPEDLESDPALLAVCRGAARFLLAYISVL